MAKLSLGLLVLFLVELAVMIKVGSAMGALAVVLLLIVSAGYGMSLVRSQGLKTLMSIQQQLAVGETPAQSMFEGVMLLLAGALFIFPGFVSDFVALLLLQKTIRRKVADRVVRSGRWRVMGSGPFAGFGASQQHSGQQGGTTVDGEYERKDDKRLK